MSLSVIEGVLRRKKYPPVTFFLRCRQQRTMARTVSATVPRETPIAMPSFLSLPRPWSWLSPVGAGVVVSACVDVDDHVDDDEDVVAADEEPPFEILPVGADCTLCVEPSMTTAVGQVKLAT